MSWIKNLKIGQKLSVSIGTLSIVSIIIAFVGLTTISGLNERTKAMYNENYIYSLMLADINNSISEMQSEYLEALYVQGVNVKTKQETVSSTITGQQNQMSTYKSRILDAEETRLFEDVQSQIQEYNEEVEKAMELIVQGQKQQAIKEISIVDTELKGCKDAINSLLAYNRTLAETKSVKNNQAVKTGQILFLMIELVGLSMGIGIAISIAKSIVKQLSMIGKATGQIAKGNLDVELHIESDDEIGQLAKNFKLMTNTLKELIGNIEASASQVAQGAKQVADSSVILSQGAMKQAGSIQELTGAIEEISTQIKTNTENTSAANDLATQVERKADYGNEKMQEMIVGIKEVEISATQVSKIIKVIDDIAFQTNILALNAAVEAARAGQHGKGFAVVAEEVRNLAARSADAAKETTVIIEDAIARVGGVTKLTTDTVVEFENIVSGIKQISEVLDNITLSCEEQTVGIEQINQGTLQISDVIQHNSGTSEEVAAASEELASQAELMRAEVSKFESASLREHSVRMPYDYKSSKTQDMSMQYNISDEEFGKY